MTATATYEWSALIERLQYHRERLKLNKVLIAKMIKEHYGKSFWSLSDGEIVELGKTMKECNTVEELQEKLPKKVEVIMQDTDIFNSI
ncbi:hypothetical protein [Geminocystis sp. NIES-3709]|uniref:hypothetical protein n=1 Tax=Geminocystis sp. NIES-3709 TaxID=1617448 RepID=UPI000825D2C1|nr:hypothetical protein [Geminocystis sp. NIES-3709]